jgi:diguanylate cyclase (GGDEF)-like protein
MLVVDDCRSIHRSGVFIMTHAEESAEHATPPRGTSTGKSLASASAESTGIRVALLERYAGAVREMRSGCFSVELPGTRDATLRQLGEEIGALADDLEHRFARYSRLSRISVDVNSGLMLERVYESFRGVIPYERIGCALLDHATWTLRARWARTEAREPVIGQGYEQSLTGSSLEQIISSGQPRIIEDLQQYLVEHPQSDATRRIVQEGMRSSLTCPLVARGRPIGFLFFSSLRARVYEPAHARTFGEIAEQLSVVVEKSLLYERLCQLNAQLTASHARLEHLSSHDMVTGLPNRSVILGELERVAARSARGTSRFGVLMIDVDFFKRINDQHGHLAGDAVLRQVGEALARVVRSGEVVGRYGGDEFAAVIEGCDATTLVSTAERLRCAVSDSVMHYEQGRIGVTLTVGGALSKPGVGTSGNRILATADRALYAAKAAGRNRSLVVGTPD